MRWLYEHRGTRWAFYFAHWLGLDDEQDRRGWVYGLLEVGVMAAFWLALVNFISAS